MIALRDERGTGLVAGIAIMFSMTFLSLVWLARDVDRGISNESAAQSIAFQAARSAAQSASIADLRSGVIVIDPAAANGAANSTATRLFGSYGVTGSVTRFGIDRDGTRVTVEVTIVDGSTEVRGTGIVTAVRVE
ncbi:MAG: hypothetical protein ACE37B_13000 [Ilumatobacter sp.]|uniref:hypothetical protein n=1 Tax=Ilumatobacter sp. TaxID=1967498 RepID=UPI00391A4A94